MTKTAEEIRTELKKRRTKKKKNQWVKIKEGQKTYIRIGPPWKKGGEFWKDQYFHGWFGNQVFCRKNDINPKTGKPRKCPVCARVAELKTDRSTFGKKLWSLIRQNSKGLWNVLVVEKMIKKENGAVKVKRYEHNKFQILQLSAKWQAIMMDIFADEDYRDKSILGVTHSKFGRLIKAKREGSGRDDTVYTFTPVDKESPIFEDKEKRMAILKTLVDLDGIVKGSSQEECEAFLEKAEKKARKLAGDKKKDKDEDAEDGEDEEEEDEEADEKDEKEDEDEEESDDDDDESDSESGKSDDEDEDDLEKKYKKMKKGLKKKKSKDEDEEEDDDE